MKVITAKFTLKDGSKFSSWIEFDYPTKRVPILHSGPRSSPIRKWTESDGHIFEAMARDLARQYGATVEFTESGTAQKWEDDRLDPGEEEEEEEEETP